MKNGFTHILLADNNHEECNLLKIALENLRIKTKVETVNNGDELLQYLSTPDATYLQILFLDQNVSGNAGNDYLHRLRNLKKDAAIAIYSTDATEKEIEELLVEGANVYIKKSSDFQAFKKKLENVLALNWQYQNSGLNRDNFILSL